MTVRITYELSMDAQYLCMWSEDSDRSRHFVAGDGIVVPRNQPVPSEARHQITTVMLVQLLDELLAFGIRPSSNAWAAGHMADLKAHISFAERVAFKLLEQPQVQADANSPATR